MPLRLVPSPPIRGLTPDPEVTDPALLAAFVERGESWAFEAIVGRHGPMVWRVCRGLLGDSAEAEDAFQATFLVLVRAAPSVREGQALARWLFEVARRTSLKARARSWSRGSCSTGAPREVLMAVEVADRTEPGPDPDREEEARELYEELGRVPERLRTPLILCYLEGMSCEQAARKLRVPLGTLKNRLARGRDVLRSRLARRGVGVASALLVAWLTRSASAAPAGLSEATVNACLLARVTPALPETLAVPVARLVEAELARARLFRFAMITAAAVALVLALASRSSGPSWPVPGRGPSAAGWINAPTPSVPIPPGVEAPVTSQSSVTGIQAVVEPSCHALPTLAP